MEGIQRADSMVKNKKKNFYLKIWKISRIARFKKILKTLKKFKSLKNFISWKKNFNLKNFKLQNYKTSKFKIFKNSKIEKISKKL